MTNSRTVGGTSATLLSKENIAALAKNLPWRVRLVLRALLGMQSGSLTIVFPDGRTVVAKGSSPGPDASLRLKNWNIAYRSLATGTIGVAETYMDGDWDSPDIAAFLELFLVNADAAKTYAGGQGSVMRLVERVRHWMNANTRAGSRRNIAAHYDLGNDFYAAWLDPTMSYSSARFDGAAVDLESAQQRKLDTIAERLGAAGAVLEIGCGWGSLARRLAAGGARVTAISLSEEQLAWARAHHGDAGIDFHNADYRDVEGQFDGIASVEMVEAVGREYWPAWFDCIARCLKPGGRAAIQYIAIRDDLFEAYARSADFIQTYVFPGGLLVSESEFRRLAGERGLEWRDQASFGPDYAETLRLWRANFDRAVAEARLPPGFDERFVGLWRFYLMYCEGGFRGGGIDVAQATLVKR